MIGERLVRSFEQELDHILFHLCQMQRPVVALLQEPLSAEAFSEYAAQLPFHLPSELGRLYAWRNGTRCKGGDILDDLHFFPGFYFLSIEEAMDCYRAFKSDPRWNRSWFPVFSNGGGDFYAVWGKEGPSERGEVVGFLLGQSEQIVEYESLEAMIRTLSACYDEGVFWLDQNGYLEADDAAQMEIAKRYNPSLPFYQDTD